MFEKSEYFGKYVLSAVQNEEEFGRLLMSKAEDFMQEIDSYKKNKVPQYAATPDVMDAWAKSAAQKMAYTIDQSILKELDVPKKERKPKKKAFIVPDKDIDGSIDWDF